MSKSQRARLEEEHGRWLKDILVERYVEAGLPVATIAAQLNVPRGAVYYWIKQFGLERPVHQCPTCGQRTSLPLPPKEVARGQ